MSGYLKLKGVGATYSQSSPLLVDARWYYNWGINPVIYPGVESVPMFWNGSNVGRSVGGNSPWVMWFNEPDLANQANMTPEYAASLWNQYISHYRQYHHVAPVATRFEWLETWIDMVAVMPDAIAIHPYVTAGMDAIAALRNQIDRAVSFANKHSIAEIWLTEWGMVHLDLAPQIQFMKDAIPVIESYDLITRYAWFQQSYRGDEPWAFSNCHNMSLEDYYTGKLTELGKIYRGNADCDFNRDGEIDILDLVRFAQSFGQKVTW